MTLRQQWLVVLGVVALLGGGLVAATRYMGDELFPVSVGTPAPDFRAATLDTAAAPRTKTLADYRGRVVLLNVWATWCAPCRVEMPSIEALHRAYGPEGLAVVAVSIDDPGQEKTVRDFARELGLTFEILHDPAGEIRKSYQTTGVPETFVIGPDGVIRKKIIGAADWNSEGNRALVARLLADARH
jgi:cytochrome c biogenesis protein CcmG/thiol:disulfide interchange protein DsbE